MKYGGRSWLIVTVAVLGSTSGMLAFENISRALQPAAARQAVFFIVDDLQVTPEGRPQMAEALRSVRDLLVHDGDFVGMTSVGGASVHLPLSPDPTGERLGAAVAKFLAAPLLGTTEADQSFRARRLAMAAISTTFDIAGTLRQVPDRQLTIVYASPNQGGFNEQRLSLARLLLGRMSSIQWPADPARNLTDDDLVVQMAATLDQARRAGIAIRLVSSNPADGLLSSNIAAVQ